MTDSSPSLASQRRHLLPRTPSDRVVFVALGAGVAVALALHADPLLGLVPGAIAALVQKLNGHVQAWRLGGVERAFVMESSAISFYALVLAFLVVGALQGVGATPYFNAVQWAIGALFLDTAVRSWRESRFA